jgi:serine/threonine protein kinase
MIARFGLLLLLVAAAIPRNADAFVLTRCGVPVHELSRDPFRRAALALRRPTAAGLDNGVCARTRSAVLGLAAKRGKGKGGQAGIPAAGGSDDKAPASSMGPGGAGAAVTTIEEAGAAEEELQGALSIDAITRKVQAAQKELRHEEGSDSFESFVSQITAPAPEQDIVLSGRIPAEWLDVDFTACLGKGGYGDVFEGKITDGPLKGAHVVAKRAYANSKGKIRWGRKDADGNTISGSISTSRSVGASAGSGSRSSSSSDDGGNAEEYLEVEDYVNRIIMDNCPHIAAPFIGDCFQEGRRWLVWHYETGAQSLSELISQGHTRGSIKGLATSLGVDSFKDNDPESLQLLVAVLGSQLLRLCEHLVEQGICHRDIKPGNLLICPNTQQVKLIDFGAAAAVGLEGRVGFDAERGPCDEKYHAPEQLIEEDHWDVYDVYSVGLTLTRVLFRPLWDPDQFNAFMDDFRGPTCRENLDTFFSNLILRQMHNMPPEKTTKALKKAPRANLELFTTLARRSRGAEYIELAQQVIPLVPKNIIDVDQAMSDADVWMEEQRELMRRARELQQYFDSYADSSNPAGVTCMSKDALRTAFEAAGVPKTPAEIDVLFAMMDTNQDGGIELNEFVTAVTQADQEAAAVTDEEEEEEEEEEVQLDSTGFITGLKALEYRFGGEVEGRITWEVLRGMMQRTPAARLAPTNALQANPKP